MYTFDDEVFPRTSSVYKCTYVYCLIVIQLLRFRWPSVGVFYFIWIQRTLVLYSLDSLGFVSV